MSSIDCPFNSSPESYMQQKENPNNLLRMYMTLQSKIWISYTCKEHLPIECNVSFKTVLLIRHHLCSRITLVPGVTNFYLWVTGITYFFFMYIRSSSAGHPGFGLLISFLDTDFCSFMFLNKTLFRDARCWKFLKMFCFLCTCII